MHCMIGVYAFNGRASFIEQVSPLMYTDNLWLYYQFSKLQITNYIKVVGVCLPAAKEQKFIIIYNIYYI